MIRPTFFHFFLLLSISLFLQIGKAQYSLTWTQSSKFQGGFNPAYSDPDKEVASILKLYDSIDDRVLRFSIDLSTRFPMASGFGKEGPSLSYVQATMKTGKDVDQTRFQFGIALSAERVVPLSRLEAAIQPVVHKKLGDEGQFIRAGFNLGFAQYSINDLNPYHLNDPSLDFTSRSVMYGRIGAGVYWHHPIRDLTWEGTKTHLFFGASVSGVEIFNPDRKQLNAFSFKYPPIIQVTSGVIQTIDQDNFVKLSGLFRSVKQNPALLHLAFQYNHAFDNVDLWCGTAFRFGNFKMLGFEIGGLIQLDNLILKYSIGTDFFFHNQRSPIGTMFESRLSSDF